MSKYENIPPTHADLQKRNLEYLYNNTPSDLESRTEYTRRGLIPTNNFGNFLVDEPKPNWHRTSQIITITGSGPTVTCW